MGLKTLVSGQQQRRGRVRTEPNDGSAVPWSWLRSGEEDTWHQPLLPCCAMAAAGLRAFFSEPHLKMAGTVGSHYSVPEAILEFAPSACRVSQPRLRTRPLHRASWSLRTSPRVGQIYEAKGWEQKTQDRKGYAHRLRRPGLGGGSACLPGFPHTG